MSMAIRTNDLAAWAGIKEAELVYAMKSSGEIYGIKIPSPLPGRGNTKTRSFDYAECEAFVKQLEEVRKRL